MRQEERRAITRAKIIAAARERFGNLGFAGTSMDAVAKDANVAKGAVYHHFANKEDLFTQVFEQVSGQLALTVASCIPQEADRISALKTATRTYFQLCAEPAITRITLQDAPSVLGFERWRQIDAAHFGGLVSAGLSLAMEEDLMTRQPVGPLSNIVLAAIQAAALDCAARADFAAAAQEYQASFDAIIDGLTCKR